MRQRSAILVAIVWTVVGSVAATPLSTFEPANKGELQTAVNAWCLNSADAEATRGPISEWDTGKVVNMQQLFQHENACNPPVGKWDTSQVKYMKSMFANAAAFNQPIGKWDTSKVADMFAMFYQAHAFNQPIGKWNTSKVANMYAMFHQAAFNQPIGEWDTSKVTNMVGIFNQAVAFNQPIGEWDTSKVTSMSGMFYEAAAFNQLIGKWGTSNVTGMKDMFYKAAAFNQPIGKWDTSKVADMFAMFYEATAFNQPIGKWNTSKVANMYAIFNQAVAFNQPIGEWDTSKVTSMSGMFYEAAAFNQLIGKWGTSNVTGMKDMFYKAAAFNQPIGKWDTSQVVNMWYMFYEATAFNQPIGKWDTGEVTRMNNMFQNAAAFDQPIGKWDTSEVRYMGGMFKNAAVFDQPIGQWDTSKVTESQHQTLAFAGMEEMFHGAAAFNQPIGRWNTSKLATMRSMFRQAAAFNQPIGKWDTSKVTTMERMFHTAVAFDQPIWKWDTSQVASMKIMFKGAIAFNQPLNDWNTNQGVNIHGMFQFATAMAPCNMMSHSSTNVRPCITVLDTKAALGDALSAWCNGTSAASPREFDVARLSDLSGLFALVPSRSTCNPPMSEWNMSNVQRMDAVFEGAAAFNQPIGKWDTSKVTRMDIMFKGAAAFNQPIGKWNTSNATRMLGMFERAAAFNQPIGNWDMRKVTRIEQMFQEATAFDQRIGKWDTSKVMNMTAMLTGAVAFTQSMSDFNMAGVAEVVGMKSAFLYLCAGGRKSSTTCASFCVSCPLGSYGIMTGDGLTAAPTQCLPCPRGHFCVASRLTACAPGTFSDAPRQTQCRRCAKGTSASDHSRNRTCDACGDGKIASANGQSMCTDCGGGEIPNDAADACAICGCAKGEYLPAGSARCKCEPCDRCPLGRFVSRPCNASAQVMPNRGCSDCVAGTYSLSWNTPQCATCDAGTFQDERAQFKCAICPIGFQGEPGRNTSTGCDACPIGTYAGIPGLHACATCGAGTFQDERAQFQCANCPIGFQGEPGRNTSTGCDACPIGTYAGIPGLHACLACQDPVVEYVTVRGATECQRCGPNAHVVPGRGGALTGLTCACDNVATDPVTNQSFGPEDVGFSPSFFETGFVDHIFARPNATRSIEACKSEIVGGKRTFPETKGCCRPCPDEGAVCQDGRVFTLPGWWRAPTGSYSHLVFAECPQAEACPGSPELVMTYDTTSPGCSDSDPCDGVWQPRPFLFPTASNATDRQAHQRLFASAAGPCRQGHGGVLCKDCVQGFLSRNGLCLACDARVSANPAPKVAIAIVGTMVTLAAVLYFVTLPDHKTDADIEHAEGAAEDSSELSEHLQNVTVVLPYIQRFAAIEAGFPAIIFPPVIGHIVRWLKLAYGSIVDVFFLISPCALHMPFTHRLFVQAAVVPWMTALAIVAYFLAKRMRARLQAKLDLVRASLRREVDVSTLTTRERLQYRRQQNTNQRISKKPLRFRMTSVFIRLTSVCLFATRFLYPGIGSVILQSFVCIDTPQGRVLLESVSLQCSGSKYWSAVGIPGVVFSVLLLLGLPAVLALAVVKERKQWMRQMREESEEKQQVVENMLKKLTALDRLRVKAHHAIVKHHHQIASRRHLVIQRFVRLFKPQYWWWFLVEMLLSLFFVGGLAIFNDNTGAQVTIGGAAACLQIVLPAKLWPFTDDKENYIALVSGILYFLQYLSGLAKLLALGSKGAKRKTQLQVADSVILIVTVAIVCGVALVLIDALWHLFQQYGMRPNLPGCCAFRRRRLLTVQTAGTRVHPVRGARDIKNKGKQEGFSLSRRLFRSATGSKAKLRKTGRKLKLEITLASYDASLRQSLSKVRPPSKKVLATCPSTLTTKYLTAWQVLLPLHLEVISVSMQATTRGFLARRATVNNQHPVNTSLPSPEELQQLTRRGTLAAAAAAAAAATATTSTVALNHQGGLNLGLGAIAEEKTAEAPEGDDDDADKTRQRKERLAATRSTPRFNSHRALVNSEENTARLLRQLQAFEAELRETGSTTGPDADASRLTKLARTSTSGGSTHKLNLVSARTAGPRSRRLSNARVVLGSKAERELLHVVAGFTAAELSGLHEAQRISDSQMVALLTLQQEAEDNMNRVALKAERSAARAVGRRKRAKRRLHHYLGQHKLTVEEARQSFAACDKDGDGRVSVQEMAQMEVLRPIFNREKRTPARSQGHGAKTKNGETESSVGTGVATGHGHAEAVEALSMLMASVDSAGGDPADTLLSIDEFLRLLFPDK